MEFGSYVDPSSPLYAHLIKTIQTVSGGRTVQALICEPSPLRSTQGFSTLGRHSFWVHESSIDAEQCLLLVLSEGSYFFFRHPEDANLALILHVDKSSIFFPMRGDMSRHQHQTLLDGEFVYSYHYQKSVFYVHDSLCLNGRKTMDYPLSRRLEMFRDEFVQPLRARYSEHDEAALPFVVLGKEYAPVERLPTLLASITRFADTDGARYVYKNGKRYNENKGLTFVSESGPYNPSGRLDWMWPDLFTVVFHVTIESSTHFSLSLRIPGSDMLIPYRSVNFGSDSARLLDDLGEAKEGKIFSVHSDGEFRYMQLALDTEVSSLVTVLKYLESVTTTVTRADLEKLAERTAQIRSRMRASNGSPTKSPSNLSCSPDFEIITESPVGRADSFSPTSKRPLSESDEDLREAKRPRLAYPELH